MSAPRRGTAVPASAFTDRVMASVARLPQPTPARAFATAIRSGTWGDAWASLSVAWHLATVRGSPVAPRVRARSMALVVAVAAVLATSSLVGAAAVRMVVPHRLEPLDRVTMLPAVIDEPMLEGPDVGKPGISSGGGAGPVSVEPSNDDNVVVDAVDSGPSEDPDQDAPEADEATDDATDDATDADADEDESDHGATTDDSDDSDASDDEADEADETDGSGHDEADETDGSGHDEDDGEGADGDVSDDGSTHDHDSDESDDSHEGDDGGE
ncbi:MAG TPA: hypothetical protein VF119_07570 [Candidatus Limnocylindrales bacterium]